MPDEEPEEQEPLSASKMAWYEQQYKEYVAPNAPGNPMASARAGDRPNYVPIV
jgi:hypothetical protein